LLRVFEKIVASTVNGECTLDELGMLLTVNRVYPGMVAEFFLAVHAIAAAVVNSMVSCFGNTACLR
jgi:hypothetical protein